MLTPRLHATGTASRAVAVFISGLTALAALASPPALGQIPGLWRYSITTDLTAVPADMRVNFPTVRFDACLTEADFTSGRAFSIQPTPGSIDRCETLDVNRRGATVTLRFACDGGLTLAGVARGTVGLHRFQMRIENRYEPAVSGVGRTTQTMTAHRVGPCAASR
ncbi:MAG: DUF3617 domain-containing protein [Casimicrobiaceae bacterium]|nr:DUF3617 domain-containing protein [Casimicrobiaceae bacterium]